MSQMRVSIGTATGVGAVAALWLLALPGCGDSSSSDSCAEVSCTSPPAKHCKDDKTLTTYTTAGTCDEGTCSYATTEVKCTGGCANDTCLEDPCKGVSCNTPPAKSCKDGSTLRSYGAAGVCASDGTCSYAPSEVTCANGCADGKCKEEPCKGVSCNVPPANSCKDATTLTTYATAGTCGSDGTCSYVATEMTCSNGCASGACKQDPCAGVSCNAPPAKSCKDGSTLTSYGTAGTCGSDGTCSYAATEVMCANGCVDGKCKDEPCKGVSCNLPPANSCKDASTLTTYAAAGTCGSDGGCSYAAAEMSCAHGCANGACKQDACAGVSCNAPPAKSCKDASTLRTYTAAGTCGGDGACSYAATEEACANGCADGACKDAATSQTWSCRNVSTIGTSPPTTTTSCLEYRGEHAKEFAEPSCTSIPPTLVRTLAASACTLTGAILRCDYPNSRSAIFYEDTRSQLEQSKMLCQAQGAKVTEL